jgi:Uma2 family endonuclease
MIAAPHHLVSVAEYHRMIDAGVFAPGERIELLDGELIAMAPMGNRHYHTISVLNEQFVLARRGRLRVGVQGPVILGDHDEPEPDLSIHAPVMGKPVAADVLAVIEVADTTLAFDRQEKRPRYARAGIPECWIVDLTEDRIEIASDPGPDGYRRLVVVRPGEPLMIPGSAVPLAWDQVFRR